MSMVKAYHGEDNMELQFCYSSWTATENQARKSNMLTRGMDVEEDDDGKKSNDNLTEIVWDKSNESFKMGMCNGMNEWNELESMKFIPLDPPPEFQDSPPPPDIDLTLFEKFAAKLVSELITEALLVSCKITWSIPCSQICHMSDALPVHGSSARWSGIRLCWTPELMPYSPCHGNRPSSRNSFSSRLSSSHNSLSVSNANKADDSSFITSAMSHETLTSNQISDMYNVPFDSDIYAVPVDVVKPDNPKPPPRTKKRHHRKRRQQQCSAGPSEPYILPITPSKNKCSSQKQPLKAVRSIDVASDSGNRCGGSSRQPRSASAGCSTNEPIHLTLQEVRQYLHTLYSSSSDSSENKHLQETFKRLSNPFKAFSDNVNSSANSENNNNNNSNINNNNNNNNNNYYRKNARNTIPVKNKKAKENCETTSKDLIKFDTHEKLKKSSCRPSFSTNIKQTLCNIFRFKKLPSPDQCLGKREIIAHSDEIGVRLSGHDDQNPPSPITKPPFSKRALPPLPRFQDDHGEIIVTDSTPLPSPQEDAPSSQQPASVADKDNQGEQTTMDFASSIEKVKDYGWYWGPISGEAAERILSNEPDGSFIVRDSSDDYYIFSLTFKLNSIVRHVRIEHDQGNFSFGSSTRFKSHTIVDFIESAVEHSRSGRYLFFLHRRPILGPMRVQLLHPVSRFKEVQSLQHMCRFVILKFVRKDLIPNLPLPRRILDYLSTQHYYSEHFIEEDQNESPPVKEDLDQILSVVHEGFS